MNETEQTATSTKEKPEKKPFPTVLVFLIGFFAVDGLIRLYAVASTLATEPFSLGGTISRIMGSRYGLMYLFIMLFDILLALQLLARMVSGRVWAIVFSSLMLLMTIIDPVELQIMGLASPLERAQVAITVFVYAFTIYYCLTPRMKRFLNR